MTTVQIRLPELFEAQKRIIDHPARFKILDCGRRFGKTIVGEDYLWEGLLLGEPVGYFAPLDVMSFEVWEATKRTFAPLIGDKSEHEKRLELVNGGTLDCWTAKSEAVRGRKYKRAVIDEAALIPTIAYWHEVVRPLLTDYEGSAMFLSTPRGQNWFWELFQMGQNEKLSDWQSWQHPTADNPYIKATEIEAARRELPERAFRQEYLAEFLEDSGSVFRNISKVCTGNAQLHGTGEFYAMGIDWGRDHDFTCISIMDIRNGQQVYLDRFNQISYTVQQGRIAAAYHAFKPSVVLAEANAMGSPNIDALRADGIPVQPFQTTNRTKNLLIDRLVLAMEQETVTLLNDAILKHELGLYRMSRTATGLWQYSAPPGGFDDTVIATALSLYACEHIHREIIMFA
jgi:hypothetical protein